MEAFNPSLFNSQWLHVPGSGQNGHDATPSHDSGAVVQNGQDAQVAPGDDWNKHIDLSDFGLTDLHAQSSSSTATISPVQLYHFPPQVAPNGQSYFSISPYNMVSYDQAAAATWTQQQQTLPISSYSTLNGATTSMTDKSQQQQSTLQQQSSPPVAPSPTLAIDPALTNQSNAPSMRPYTNNATPPISSSSVPDTDSQRSPPMSFLSPLAQTVKPQATMFISPQQMHQPQQRTLNPQQLTMGYPYMFHHPMNTQAAAQQSPMHTNLTATTSGQPSVAPQTSVKVEPVVEAPPPPPKLSLQERKAIFQKALVPLMAPHAFTNAKAVKVLIKAINEYGPSEVPTATRVKIASKIRDNASNDYFRAWSDNLDAMVLISNWLKAAVRDPLWELAMPLLHILDRLPLEVDQLRDYKVGKIIKKILNLKEPDGVVSPAVRDMASILQRKWLALIEEEEQSNPSSSPQKKKGPIIEDKSKKRKLAEDAAKASAPPAKKALTTAAAAQVKVKKEKVVAAKDAKVDSSFFSAPKPKQKLPSFKKAPTASTAASARAPPLQASAEVAQPNAVDPFQEALASMGKGRAGGSSATPEPSNTAAASSASGGTKLLKKRKSVTWAPENQLVKIRVIEKAVYDDDPVQGSHGAHSIRDLERAEGAAMHITIFEESIDWYEPYPLELPLGLSSNPERGNSSQEKVTQEEREKSTLNALYISLSQVPESPGEPAHQIPAEQVDQDVRVMVVGAEIQPYFHEEMSVADLVGQLRAVGGPGAGMADQIAATGVDMNGSAFGGGVPMDVVMGDGMAAAVGAAAAAAVGVGATTGAPGLFNGINLQALAAQLGIVIPNGVGEAGNDGFNAQQQQQQQQWGMYGQQGSVQQNQQQQMYGGEYGGYDEPRDSSNRERERDRGDRERDRDGKDGRGGRGRGRGFGARGGRGGGGGGKSKKLCNYYAQGGCKFGDACHFSHENPGGQGYYD